MGAQTNMPQYSQTRVPKGTKTELPEHSQAGMQTDSPSKVPKNSQTRMSPRTPSKVPKYPPPRVQECAKARMYQSTQGGVYALLPLRSMRTTHIFWSKIITKGPPFPSRQFPIPPSIGPSPKLFPSPSTPIS